MSQDISCVAYNTQYQRRINQIAQESASRRTWSRLNGFRTNPLLADISCGGTSTSLVDRYLNKKKYMIRNNSNNVQHATSLTKAQVYARMARGNGPDGRPSKRYANQTIDYSNPNIYDLPQRGNRLIQDCRLETPGFTFEVAMGTWSMWLKYFSQGELIPVKVDSSYMKVVPLQDWKGLGNMRIVINYDKSNVKPPADEYGFNITKVLSLKYPKGSSQLYFGPNNPYSINIIDWYDMPFTVSGEQLSNEFGALTDKVIENALGTPSLLDCSMAKCFYMTSFSNSVLEKKVGKWDATKVVDFTYTFANPRTSFNPNIFGTNWTCRDVISAEGMFFKCHNFNQDVSNIFTGSTALKDLSGTFYDCSGFNQNVNSWNTSKVLSMENMFYNAYIFNNGQAPSSTSTVGNFPLDKWHVEKVTTMKCMFYNATSFNQSLDTWWPVDVSDMSYMFYAKRTPRIFSIFNNGHTDPYHYQPYSSKGKPFWEEDATKKKRTTNLRITSHMFHNTFFAGDISGWDIHLLHDASGMLHNCAMTPWTYSNMLIGWQNQKPNIQSNVPLGAMYAPQSDPGDPGWLDASFASGIQYLEAANSARNNPSTGLTGTAGGYQWDISDGGLLFFGDSMKIVFVSSNWKDIADSLQFDRFDKSVAWKGMPVHWTPGSAAAKNLITPHYSYPGHTIFEIGGINDESLFPSPAGFSMKDVLTDLSNSNFVGPYGCTIIDWSGALFEPSGCQFSVGPTKGFNFDCSWNGALPPVPSFYPPSPPLSVPNIRKNSSLESAFYYAQADVSFGSLGDGHYKWDVSGVTNMANMFYNCTTFDAPLNWNVQNVKDMSGMFYNCSKFAGMNLNHWNVHNVTNMRSMFTNCNIFNNTLDWDVVKVKDMQHMFNGCKGFDQLITFNNLTQVTDMKYMFANCNKFSGNGSNFIQWDVSNVSDMQHMFDLCSKFEGKYIRSWDVSNVINMQYMFNQASVFNEDISGWKVHKVTNMSYMFCNCSDFNQDISGWDVSMVNNMSYMFNGATKFISDISNWYVYNVTDMQYMFHSASKFSHDLGNWPIYHLNKVHNMFTDSLMATTYNKNSSRTVAGWLSYRNGAKDGAPNIVLDPLTGWTNNGLFDYSYVFLGNPPPQNESFSYVGQNYKNPNLSPTYGLASAWNVSRLPDASEGFKDNDKFNDDITPWDTANVTNMTYMFAGAQAFNKDIGGWDVQNVTNMAFMFSGAQAFNQNIGGWDVQNVTNMTYMFAGAQAFNKDIGGWDVQNVTNMAFMFSGAQAFNQNIGGWDVQNVTNMAFMFSGADSFNQNIDNWNVSNVSFMQYMFHDAKKFNNGSHDLKWISGTGTEQVKDMQRMFKNAYSFVGNGINNWNVSEVTDMCEMFYIPLGTTSVFNPPNPMVAADWNTAKVQDMSGMFYNCQALKWNILVKPSDGQLFNWDLTKTTTTRFMFYNCTNFYGTMQITNTNNVTDMQYMFYNCTQLKTSGILCANFHTWTVSKVSYMQYMFYNCTHFDAPCIDTQIWNWSTDNVLNMQGMFGGCKNMNPTLNFNTENVTDMSGMFQYCSKFKGHGLSNWDVGEVTTMQSMFEMNDSLHGVFDEDISGWHITGWRSGTSSVLSSSGKNMFDNCGMSPTNVTRLMINWIIDVCNNNLKPNYVAFGMKNCYVYSDIMPPQFTGYLASVASLGQAMDWILGLPPPLGGALWGGQFTDAPKPPGWPQNVISTSTSYNSYNPLTKFITYVLYDSGNFNINDSIGIDCSLLLVGGGAGGGGINSQPPTGAAAGNWIMAGGGGGGGEVKAQNELLAGTYNIKVGDGGMGGVPLDQSANGQDGMNSNICTNGGTIIVSAAGGGCGKGATPTASGWSPPAPPWWPVGGQGGNAGSGSNGGQSAIIYNRWLVNTLGIMAGGGGSGAHPFMGQGGDASFNDQGNASSLYNAVRSPSPPPISTPHITDPWTQPHPPDCSGGRGGAGISFEVPNSTGWRSTDYFSGIPMLGPGGGGGAASGGGSDLTTQFGTRVQMFWGPAGDWDGTLSDTPSDKGAGKPNKPGWGAVACHDGFNGFNTTSGPPHNTIFTGKQDTDGADGSPNTGGGGGGGALDGYKRTTSEINASGGKGGSGVVYIKFYLGSI